MKRRFSVGLLAAGGWLLEARETQAGMPSVVLTDLVRMRVQTISFFLLVVLLCAWGVQAIWNGLRGDFTRLPRLSYRKAVGLVVLWGLLFVLVLTMISGARELMTPGAWEKQGLTYRLTDEAANRSLDAELAKERRQKLESLRMLLWHYAASHGGKFPPDASAAEIPVAMWQVPDPSEMRYVYVRGQSADRGSLPLVYEPGLFRGDPLVLRTDGLIVSMSTAAIRQALEGREAR